MEDEQRAYQARLATRDIRTWEPPLPKKDKVQGGGDWLPFYGLTCIAWVDPTSKLFRELCRVQTALKTQLEAAGLDDLYVFLEPESFHMTICDLVAGNDPVPETVKTELIEQVYGAFERIGRPGLIRCQPTGLGLKRTITAMVHFSDPAELKTVLDMERTIKATTGVNMRAFTGHISLAYLIPRPVKSVQAVKDVMLAYEHHVFGEFVFDHFDLAEFTDMNTYLPILAKNLVDGTVRRW